MPAAGGNFLRFYAPVGRFPFRKWWFGMQSPIFWTFKGTYMPSFDPIYAPTLYMPFFQPQPYITVFFKHRSCCRGIDFHFKTCVFVNTRCVFCLGMLCGPRKLQKWRVHDFYFSKNKKITPYDKYVESYSLLKLTNNIQYSTADTTAKSSKLIDV